VKSLGKVAKKRAQEFEIERAELEKMLQKFEKLDGKMGRIGRMGNSEDVSVPEGIGLYHG